MKKMRKLIPAVAMLLVSAVLLSTATFAWFTMNEAVTATGMQVKAKASGNLLVSLAPLTAADQNINVELKSDSTHTDIVPVTYYAGAPSEGETPAVPAAWQIPSDASKVDPLYGYMNGTSLKTTDMSLAFKTSPHFIDYTVYVATAGEAMDDQNLYVTMNMISAPEDISNAYSIAFYVGPNLENSDVGTFAGYINYKTFADKAGDKVYLNGTYDIPTTFEKNADTADGLRIVMRVFVDGNLKYDQQVYTSVPDYKLVAENTKYGAGDNLKYYAKDGDKYVLQSKDLWTADTDVGGLYTWDGTKMTNGTLVDKYYVNNDDIPTGFTSFDVTIGATETKPSGATTTKGILPAN